MSYNTLKHETAREYCEILELRLDINDPSLDDTFALNPASFGTPKTTNDPRAYTGNDFRYYRYSQTAMSGIQCFGVNSLKLGNFSSPKIDPSKSIGLRANLSVTISDFIDSDSYTLQGPYVDRAVNDTSHFCKLFARNHIKNKQAKIYRGYLVDGKFDVANFETETYIVESYQNPTKSGSVSLNLVDVLALSNIKNKKLPEQTNGVVAFNLNSSSTTLTFTPSVADEYGPIGATGRIVINEEYMDYTVATATTMTVVRGVNGTANQEHNAGDTIQKAIANDNYNIVDWITDIISESDIPSSYIDPAWQTLKSNELSEYNLTYTMAKPQTIEKWLNELIVVGGLSMWTDVKTEKIKISAQPEFDSSIYTFTEHDYKADSFTIKRLDSKHINRQRILWGKSNPAKTDELLYKSFESISSEILPTKLGYTSQGQTIKTDWLNGLDNLAAAIANRTVQRFDVPPFEASFVVDSSLVGLLKNNNALGIGEVVEYEAPRHIEVDRYGNTVKRFAQITGLSQTSEKYWKLTLLSYKANIPTNVDYYINNNDDDFILSTALAANVPDFANNVTREYVVVISQGVTIGSTNDGLNNYAFDTGTFPAGASLKLINAGEIIGAAPIGGRGGFAYWEAGLPDPDSADGINGDNGGSALIVQCDTVIDNLTGLIGGAGGGGKGGVSVAGSSQLIAGGGGGNGAGTNQPSPVSGGNATSTNGGSASGEFGQLGSKTVGGLGGLDSDMTLSRAGKNGGSLGENSVDGNGLAGYAINRNGFTVNIIAGNNDAQIKGLTIG